MDTEKSSAPDLSRIDERKRILFIRAGAPPETEKNDEIATTSGRLTGPEARGFYEGLLREEAVDGTSKSSVKIKEEPADEKVVIGKFEAHDENPELRYFCESCNREFVGDPAVHETTTNHILSMGHEGTSYVGYGIPESNKGYRLLKQTGWDEQQGLGKEGEGKKFPVRTILKRNRAGLGAEKTVPKVTHFAANDEKAVETIRIRQSSRSVKKELKKKAEADRRMARNFRAAFNMSDDVAEYLGI